MKTSLNQQMDKALFSLKKQKQNNQYQENKNNMIQTNKPNIKIQLVVNQQANWTNKLLEHPLNIGILKKWLN